MQNAAAFNPLEYVHRLEDAGVPHAQAEVQVQIFSEIIESNLATKQDILDLKRDIKDSDNSHKLDIKELDNKLEIKIGEVKRDMKELENNLKRDMKELELSLTAKIAESKSEIIKWTVASVFGSVGLFATIIKLLG